TGDENAFRAQLRRLRGEQARVQKDFREYFEKEKEKLAAEKRQNPAAAEKSEETSRKTMEGSSVRNAEFNAGLEEMKRISHRGYGNFLNPAAIFLSGLGSLRDGNFENARIDFQRLFEAMPGNPMFRQYYVTVLGKCGRQIPPELKGTPPFGFSPERDCVHVIFANGKSAAFKQIAVYFPVMTAWPMCEFYPAPFERLHVDADGREHQTFPLADMDGILAQEFQERLPGIITRIVLSTLIKEGAYHAGLIAVSSTRMDPTVKMIVLLSIALGGAVYRAAVNTADTRSWEILPKEFQMTTFPMPVKREVVLELRGAAGAAAVRTSVRIPRECRSAVLFVSAPSSRNISCHVLPITSK
ncbi:MAG: hypothetical protein J6331_07525, partial [Lentisphaeria bacterium]|nr:hypothetical protein [Lentisphaeria bacterium]